MWFVALFWAAERAFSVILSAKILYSPYMVEKYVNLSFLKCYRYY